MLRTHTRSTIRRPLCSSQMMEMLESRVLLTTYYVSNMGNDALPGTTPATAWATAEKVNATVFAPGDMILFERGGNWREKLTASSDGTVDEPILYGDYGDESLAKPNFHGSNIVPNGAFTLVSGSTYSFSVSSLDAPAAYWVFADHQALLAATGSNDMPSNSFFISGDTVFINTGGSNPNVGDVLYTASVRGQGANADSSLINSNAKSNIIFRNLVGRETAEVPGGGNLAGGIPDAYVFRIFGGSNVQVIDCEAYYGGKHHFGAISTTGFVGKGLISEGSVQGVAGNELPYGNATAMVAYSTADRHGDTYQFIDCIIRDYSGAQPAFITHNDGSDSIGSILLENLQSYGSPVAILPGPGVQTTIRGGFLLNSNIDVYGNASNITNIDGLKITGDNAKITFYAGNSTIQNVLIEGSGQDGGLYIVGPDNTIRFNTLVMKDWSGSAIRLGDGATNSVVYGNVVSGTARGLKVQGAPAYTTHHNFYGSAAPQFLVDGQTLSLVQMQANGKESGSVAGDPEFVDAAAGDYSLLPGSGGINLVPTDGIEGISADIRGLQRPNSGAYDAGAYETVLDNHAPTIQSDAAAAPQIVDGTTTGLTVLGADPEGEQTLRYTWSVTGTPPAPVAFSANGTNAAKTTTAIFSSAGTYHFLVTVSDGQYEVTSPIMVTVNQTATMVKVMPATRFVPVNTAQQYSAAVVDQFGNSVVGAPITWEVVSGDGTISVAGLYSAPGVTGSATIRATSGAFSGTAEAMIVPPNQAPTIATPASASPNPVTGITTTLSVLGADDNGEANLTYTWNIAGTPPAPVTFQGVNGQNGSRNIGVSFSANGTYDFQVIITDSHGATTTSATSVVVNTIVPIVVDGNKDPRYGSPVVVQTQATNNGNGVVVADPSAPFTQLSAAYGIIDLEEDRLYLFLAGSLFSSNSHLDLLIDSKVGTGVANLNSLAGVGPWGSAFASVTLDEGFRPDHILSLGGGGGQYLDYYNFNSGVYAAQVLSGDPANLLVTSSSPIPYYQSRVNNAAGDTRIAAGDGASVTTGMEFAFKLSDLGYTAEDYAAGRPINVAALVSHGSHTVATNQILGAYTPNAQELQNDAGVYTWYSGGNFNFANETRFAGKQFFAITPDAPLGPVNSAPTIAVPAAASSPVIATTAVLSVLGDDEGGESNLVYTWAVIGTPPAAVSFSANGTNAAKSTIATFARAGVYDFIVTVSDGVLSANSEVRIVVDQTSSAVVVSPSSVTVASGGTRQFDATVSDQFGQPIDNAPVVWSMQSGGGSISGTGLYTAAAQGGSAVVHASSGLVSAVASVTIQSPANAGPIIVSPASVATGNGAGTTMLLSVLGDDDGGESNLIYTWSVLSAPDGAPTPTFNLNGVNAAKNVTARFSLAGIYRFQVMVTDAQGQSTADTVEVLVSQRVTMLVLSYPTPRIDAGTTQQFTAGAIDQFNQPVAAPVVEWSIASGKGSISASGLYTAPSTAGSVSIMAQVGKVKAKAGVNIVAPPPAPLVSAVVASVNMGAFFNASASASTILSMLTDEKEVSLLDALDV